MGDIQVGVLVPPNSYCQSIAGEVVIKLFKQRYIFIMYDICVNDTQSERVSEIISFKHKYITNPTVSRAGAVIETAQDLSKA